MSKIEKILESHLGNSSIILGVLHDLTYSMVLGALIGEMKEVAKEERIGLKEIRHDKEATKIGINEVKKLEALIVDLEKVRIPAAMDIKDMIRMRYMR